MYVCIHIYIYIYYKYHILLLLLVVVVVVVLLYLAEAALCRVRRTREVSRGDLAVISPTIASNASLNFKQNLEFHPSGKICFSTGDRSPVIGTVQQERPMLEDFRTRDSGVSTLEADESKSRPRRPGTSSRSKRVFSGILSRPSAYQPDS